MKLAHCVLSRVGESFTSDLAPLGNKPYPWALHLILLLPLLLLLGGICLSLDWWGDIPQKSFLGLRQDYSFTTELVSFITNYATFGLHGVYLILLIYACITNDAELQRFIIRYAFVQLCFTLCMSLLLKNGLGMPRPGKEWPPLPWSGKSSYHSFPSGHTTEIVAAALPLAFMFRKLWLYVALALLIALVAFSRLWLGWHHPVDLLGGIVLGSCSAWLICKNPGTSCSRKFFKLNSAPPPKTRGTHEQAQ